MVTPQQPMRRLFQYLGSYRNRLGFATTSSILNKIADLMPPLMVGWIIDAVSKAGPEWVYGVTGSVEPWPNAVFLCIMIVIVFGIESFFEWLFQLEFMKLAQEVQHDLRLDAYKQLQSRELAYFEEKRTGNLMAMLNDDINQLERFLNSSFNEIIQLITLFIFGAVTIFALSWKLVLFSMLPIPLILLGSFYYQKMVAPKYKRVRETVGDLSNRLENNISGILVIKSFTAEKFEAERVEEVSKAYRDANFDAIKLSAIYVPLIRMLIAFGFAAGMLLCCYWLLNGIGNFTLGQLTFFAMMIQRLLWPVTRLGRVFDEYERARASARRIFGLMDSPNQIHNPPASKKTTIFRGDIAVNAVDFHYSNDIPILKNVSFQLAAGKTIGIAGSTGSGKTTMIKLLLRLYDVKSGSITLDGTNIKEINLQSLRKNISLVSQDVYLFHGTIAENIAYGRLGASRESIEEASKQAQLHDFVASLPDGYDALVGEKGIKLSGGQRQRLSIARAILKDAPILILDEATSSVDTETERAIQENLFQLVQNRTALIIAHRLSTIRHTDSIIVLKDGEISEEGTHEQLLLSNGIYADLWNVQIGEIGK